MRDKFKIILIFLFFLLTRLFPYINNPVPTGYDAGLYLLNFKLFPHIPQWIQIGFAPGLYAFLYPFFKIGLSPETILIPLSIFSQVLLFFSLYFFGRKIFNMKTVLFILLIFSVSSIQFRTFWYFYVNNTLGLSFLIFALYFSSINTFIPALIFTLLVGFFHLPTFLILFLVIITEMIFNKNQRLFYVGIAGSAACILLLYYFSHLQQTIQPYFSPLVKSVLPVRIITGEKIPFTGAFYNFSTFFLLTFLYLPLVLYGLHVIRHKFYVLRPFIVGLIITSLLVFTKFSFYQRFLIPLDIFLVIFGGLGLSHLYEKFRKKKQITDYLQFYIVILIVFVVGFINKTSSPLITQPVFNEIKLFSKTVPSGYVLSLSPQDHAWLMGYTSQKIISHNFGEFDRYWTNDQWTAFFSNLPVDDRISLLKLLPRPLHIYINEQYTRIFENLLRSPCIKGKTLHFFEVRC